MKHLFLTFLIATLLAPQVTFAALTDNIVAYWALDESSGNAADSVGSNTLTNNNSVAFNAGLIGNAANFGDPNTTKYFNSSGNIVGTGSITFNAWFRTSETTAGSMQILGGTGTASQEFRFSILPSAGLARASRFNGGSATNVDNSVSVFDGNWHMITATWNSSGGSITVYMDGTALGTTGTNTGTGGASSATTNMGQLFGEYFQGELDEVGVWSRVLTTDEITELYNGGAGFAYPFVAAEEADEDIIWFFLHA